MSTNLSKPDFRTFSDGFWSNFSSHRFRFGFRPCGQPSWWQGRPTSIVSDQPSFVATPFGWRGCFCCFVFPALFRKSFRPRIDDRCWKDAVSDGIEEGSNHKTTKIIWNLSDDLETSSLLSLSSKQQKISISIYSRPIIRMMDPDRVW